MSCILFKLVYWTAWVGIICNRWGPLSIQTIYMNNLIMELSSKEQNSLLMYCDRKLKAITERDCTDEADCIYNPYCRFSFRRAYKTIEPLVRKQTNILKMYETSIKDMDKSQKKEFMGIIGMVDDYIKYTNAEVDYPIRHNIFNEDTEAKEIDKLNITKLNKFINVKTNLVCICYIIVIGGSYYI